jgi:hypothetical protein
VAGSSAAVHWAAQEPDKAAAWVEELPESEQREYAARNLVYTWARHDLEAATAWLEEQAPGKSRELAGLELAKMQVERDPEAAFNLIQSMEDGHESYRMFKESLQSLVRIDASKAEAVVAQAALSEGMRAKAEKVVAEAAAMAEFFLP